MIGRKTKQVIDEQVHCEICGKSNKGIKLERLDGMAIRICATCRKAGQKNTHPGPEGR